MSESIKIATLNLCLGLKNKKEEVKRLVTSNNIDIFCLQETDIPGNFPVEMLTFRGYNYENEFNPFKMIKNTIPIYEKVLYLKASWEEKLVIKIE